MNKTCLKQLNIFVQNKFCYNRIFQTIQISINMKHSIHIPSKGYFHSIREFYLHSDKPLGVGSFGTVKLATHVRTNKNYAIKIVDIDEDMSQSQLKILQRQIMLHSMLDHPHVIKLWDTIQSENYVYMIMEYASTGSLFHYQNIHTKFSQMQGYKFFYQTLDALRYLHSLNIIHRDIKPENLLLDNDHNIKLCDFGWATENITQKRSTFCGTYEYMAPQMAYEKQYDYRIDIWAIGILLYELIHGHAPFKAKTLEQIKQKISKGSYEISNICSKQLKTLIMNILQFDPEDRPSLSQISNSEWAIRIPTTIMTKITGNQNGKIKKIQKKMGRKLSSEDLTKTTKNQTFVTKHKKYQSQDFESSFKNVGNVCPPKYQIKHQLANALLKKNQQNGIVGIGFKKPLKKKCRTQGSQYIEKISNPTGDSKLFSQFSNKVDPKQLKQNNFYNTCKTLTIEDYSSTHHHSTSKMKKLQQKITQLTSKYIGDRKKIKQTKI